MNLEFAKPFDGYQPELPLFEKVMASERFSELIDMLFQSYCPDEPVGEDEYGLRLFWGQSNHGYDITVMRSTGMRQIMITEMNGSSGGDSVEYWLGDDNIVRRQDSLNTDILKKLYKNDAQNPIIGKVALSQGDLKESWIYELREHEKNQMLEEEFRLNNQPVDDLEIYSLTRFVYQARYIPE